MLEPELTSVAIPIADLGSQALILLLDVLAHKPVAAETVIPLHLVIRHSTRLPSQRPSNRRRGDLRSPAPSEPRDHRRGDLRSPAPASAAEAADHRRGDLRSPAPASEG
jgi:hypothetical protein